jgi:uncharacterized protein (TIGR04255 family)
MCEQDLRFMAEAPHFETIHPAHAIERCGMSVVFTEGMPEKAFQRVVASLRSNAEKMGFEQARQSPAIEIDLTTGKLNPVGARQGPVTFVSSDGAFQFIAAPNILFWATTRYVRWAPFAGQFETILGSTLEDYLENLTLGAVQLEYLDRVITHPLIDGKSSISSGIWRNAGIFDQMGDPSPFGRYSASGQ